MPSGHSFKFSHSLFGITGPKKSELLTGESYTGVYQPVVCVDTKPKRKAKSSVHFLCWVLLGFSVLVNVSLVGYLVYHGAFRPDDSMTGHHDITVHSDLSDSICVSCDSLHVHDPRSAPLLPEVEVVELTSSSSMCCLKHQEHLQNLLKLIVGEYYHSKSGGNLTGDFHLSPTSVPAAHLYLHKDKAKTGHGRLSWDDETGYGTAHVTGGVIYKNGSLHVPQDGVYFLYSHVTISPVESPSVLDLVHCVQRFNPHLPRMGKQLLMISKTSLGSERTSYLAANLRLRRDDQIFVEFSNQSLIYSFPPANFFGLHQL